MNSEPLYKESQKKYNQEHPKKKTIVILIPVQCFYLNFAVYATYDKKLLREIG